MHERVISPTDYPDVQGPLIFLNGPIQGAEDWQSKAIEIIQGLDLQGSIIIANPRREYMTGHFVYTEQVRWERFYRQRARDNGVNMFWLAKEIEHDPTRSFAQTTRFELAESLGWYLNRGHKHPSKMFIGIEKGFIGANYIEYVVSHDYSEEGGEIIPIFNDNLEYTCQMAVEEILERRDE